MFTTKKNFLGFFLLSGCVQKSVTPTNSETKPNPLVQDKEPAAATTTSLIQKTWTGRVFLQKFIQKPDASAPPQKQLIIQNEQTSNFGCYF